MHAARRLFPDTDVSRCFTNVKHEGPRISVTFVDDISSLIFTTHQVIDVFERLSYQIREIYNEKASAGLDYFENTFIGRFRRNGNRVVPIFPLEMWNIFHRRNQEIPRTSDPIEEWHNKIPNAMC